LNSLLSSCDFSCFWSGQPPAVSRRGSCQRGGGGVMLLKRGRGGEYGGVMFMFFSRMAS
jgi:hypothetical protein